MTPITEIGEMTISDAKNDYFFSPSFSAMTRIGSPYEIVESYAILNGSIASTYIDIMTSAIQRRQSVSQLQRVTYASITGKAADDEWVFSTIRRLASRGLLSTAINVMQACCDEDITALVGEWRPGKRGIVYRAGGMSIGEIILIANTLIEHGLMGKAPLRVLQRNEGKDQFTKEFRAIDYISAAQAHLGMSRADAECLTMTHFQLLMKAKYPEPKGFTRAEYDAVMDADDKRIEELKAGKRRLVKSMRDVRKAA